MTQNEFKNTKEKGLKVTMDKAIKVLNELNPVSIHQFGSGGRGESNEFSDLDLFVTLPDDTFEQTVNNKLETYSKVGTILLRLWNTNQNPVGWYHDLIIYDTENGLIHVDYYLTPRSKVILPPDSKLIQGEDNDEAGEWTTSELENSAGHDLYEAILVMTYIGVKGVVRKWDAGFFDFLRTLYNSYRRDENPIIPELPEGNNYELVEAILSNLKNDGNERQQKANKKIEQYVAEVKRLY